MKLCLSILHYIRQSMPYYAVAKGRNAGIYHSWDECRAQVHQFSGPVFKKFKSETEAQNYIKENQVSSKQCDSNSNVSSSNKHFKSLTLPEKIYPLGRKHSVLSSDEEKVSLKRKRNVLGNNGKEKHDKDDNAKININLINLLSSDNNSLDRVEKKEITKYIIDEDGFVSVFTDGACSSNGRKGARAGIGVWFGDDHALNVSMPVQGRATNNMAEIQAVTVAALQAKKAGIKRLKINTDSQFLISCITKWMPKWKKNEWKTVDGKDVINKCELLEMEKALAPFKIVWNHVNGHVGIHGNEMADRLARAGCETYKEPATD